MFLLLLLRLLNILIVEGNEKYFILNSLTMIDPSTGWFKIVQYIDKQEAKI